MYISGLSSESIFVFSLQSEKCVIFLNFRKIQDNSLWSRTALNKRIIGILSTWCETVHAFCLIMC